MERINELAIPAVTERPPVTWLLPVRNGMPFLPLTLSSIAAQTYPNAVILAWDNASTDGTLEELRRWIPSRIPGQIVTGRPLRLGPCLNAMVELAETEFCARMDADDINYPFRLERQVAFLQTHPEVGILGAQADFIDENGKPIQGWSFSNDDATLRWNARWTTAFMHPTVMYRRSVVRAAGGYHDLQPVEDADLWLRAAAHTQFANLQESLIQYRRSSASVTGRTSDFKPPMLNAVRPNAEALFPGLTAAQAMELWEAAYPDFSPARARWGHRAQLKQAAIGLARQFGKPDGYFTATQTFRDQWYHLNRRIREGWGLGPLLKWRRSLTARG